jgi:hypothetical protein
MGVTDPRGWLKRGRALASAISDEKVRETGAEAVAQNG